MCKNNKIDIYFIIIIMDNIEYDLYCKKIIAEYEYMKYIKSKKYPLFLNETKNFILNKYNQYFKFYFKYDSVEEAKQYVLFDDYLKNRFNYEMTYYEYIDAIQQNSLLFSKRENVNSDDKDDKDKDIKKIYNKLAILCHPDRCNEEWGNHIFLILNDAYNNKNLIILQNLERYWDENKTFENYDIFKNYNKADKVEADEAGETKKDKDIDIDIEKTQKEIEYMKSEMWYLWYYSDNTVLKNIFIPKEEFDLIHKDHLFKLYKYNAELNLRLIAENTLMKIILDEDEERIKIEKLKKNLKEIIY
jgi:hypothetical protein